MFKEVCGHLIMLNLYSCSPALSALLVCSWFWRTTYMSTLRQIKLKQDKEFLSLLHKKSNQEELKYEKVIAQIWCRAALTKQQALRELKYEIGSVKNLLSRCETQRNVGCFYKKSCQYVILLSAVCKSFIPSYIWFLSHNYSAEHRLWQPSLIHMSSNYVIYSCIPALQDYWEYLLNTVHDILQATIICLSYFWLSLYERKFIQSCLQD